MAEGVKKVESYTKERRVREEGNKLIAVIVGVLLLIISIIIIFGLNLNTGQIIVFILIILGFYVIVISFLFERKLIKEIYNSITNTVDRPVVMIKEINKGKRINVIHEVPKPIIHRVITPVDRPVIIKGKPVPRYEYSGSTETKTFHKNTCRFSRLIKRKYKIYSNNSGFFIKKRFRPCKVCIIKSKKV
ncbi:hypothetical protein GOV12_04335 [Candidatus Pacearchaeota archaeon]|nr:hypothetical protein [Candidatus Pacearchaeota archaeon]